MYRALVAHAFVRAGDDRAFPQLHAVAAVVLGRVERAVGAVDQGGGAEHAFVRRAVDPGVSEGCGDAHRFVADDHRRRHETLADPHGDDAGVPDARLRQHYAELLAAVTARDVVHAAAFLQRPADQLQHLVADRVAVRIVHALEVIDVEHQQRHRRAVAERAVNLGVDLLDHVPAVVEARQRVARRDFIQDAVLHREIEVLALEADHPLLELVVLVLVLLGDSDHLEDLVEQPALGLGEGLAVGGHDAEARDAEANGKRLAGLRRLAVNEDERLLEHGRKRRNDARCRGFDGTHRFDLRAIWRRSIRTPQFSHNARFGKRGFGLTRLRSFETTQLRNPATSSTLRATRSGTYSRPPGSRHR